MNGFLCVCQVQVFCLGRLNLLGRFEMKCEKIFHLDTSSLRVGGQTTVNLFVKHAKKVRVAANY